MSCKDRRRVEICRACCYININYCIPIVVFVFKSQFSVPRLYNRKFSQIFQELYQMKDEGLNYMEPIVQTFILFNTYKYKNSKL